MIRDEQSPQIPSRLVEDLRQAYAAEPIPAALDWALVERPNRRSRTHTRTWFAAAAVVVLGASLTLLVVRSPTGPAYDLNGDGVADVLDALTLVNAIRDGTAHDDPNHDGKIDQADVDVVLTSIVQLSGGAG